MAANTWTQQQPTKTVAIQQLPDDITESQVRSFRVNRFVSQTIPNICV